MPRWLSIVAKLAPTIAAIAGIPALGPIISVGIAEAEAIAGASGAEKNAHVVALATAAAAGVNAVKPGSLDEAAVMQAAQSVTSTIVDVAKAIDAAHPAD